MKQNSTKFINANKLGISYDWKLKLKSGKT